MKRLLFFLIVPLCGLAQTQTSQIFDASEIKSIVLYANEVYKVDIIASKTTNISVATRSDGENAQDIVLFSQLENKKLTFESRYSHLIADGFDKLSAHKLLSMSIELVVPEGLDVSIISNQTMLNVLGNFKSMNVEVKQGNVAILDYLGNLTVNTYSADIFLKLKKPAQVVAFSRNGSVEVPVLTNKGHLVQLSSISGNIIVK